MAGRDYGRQVYGQGERYDPFSGGQPYSSQQPYGSQQYGYDQPAGGYGSNQLYSNGGQSAYDVRDQAYYPPRRPDPFMTPQDSYEDKDYGAASSAPPVPNKYGDGANPLRRGADNPYAVGGTRKSRKRRWCIIGGIITAVLVVIAAIAVGVAVWKSNQSDSSSGGTTSGSSSDMQYIDGTAMAVKSNPNDPSQFETNSAFTQSFWGIAYTPVGAIEPDCGATLANITEDIQILSQLTTRLRTYGTACNVTNHILQAIQDTKVNMTIWIGVYLTTDNETTNEVQMQTALDALDTYGADHVSGVICGNEVLLNAQNTPSAQSQVTTWLGDKISTMRSSLESLNLGKTLPVGVGDAGAWITTALAEVADELFANEHPFFGGVPADEGAAWTWEFNENNPVPAAEAASNNPPVYIAEIGWPTGSENPANLTYEGATASIADLQIMLDTYVCAANANGSEYFWFVPFDEPWKVIFDATEDHWGMMTVNKRVKDGITLPNCPL